MMVSKGDQLLWFINFLIKKSTGSGVNNEIKQNIHLAKELNKPFIRKFEKRTAYSGFNDNI